MLIFKTLSVLSKNAYHIERLLQNWSSSVVAVSTNNLMNRCFYPPKEIKFANSRKAPGTPAGNSRKNDKPVYT